MSGRREPDADQREAKAILERVRQETEPQVGAGTGRMLSHAYEHFSAADADPGDRTEVLGTRIGRLLGLFGFLALAAMLLSGLTAG